MMVTELVFELLKLKAKMKGVFIRLICVKNLFTNHRAFG